MHNLNYGYGAALRNAIEKGTGEIVAIVDADDALASPKAFEIMVSKHREHPEASLIYSDYYECNREMKNAYPKRCNEIPPNHSFLGKFRGDQYIGTNYNISHLKTFKKEAYNKTSKKLSEDGFAVKGAYVRITDLSKNLVSSGYTDQYGKVNFDFFIGNGGGSYKKTVTSISTLSAGQWYYLIATYDGSSLKIYINGSLDNSASVTGTPWNNTAVAVMGASSVAGGSPISYFDGLIDETNIVATNLSASYIKAQYNSLFDTLITEQLFILADTGSYALTGITTGLKAFRKLLANTGSYTLTGINTAIKRSYSLISQAGSYALTGINVALGFFRKLFANAGSYSLTGFDVALYLHTVYNLILSAGSYTLTGINTGLKALRRLVSLAGSYTLTGISAGLFRAYTFILSRGSYALTGIDILFRKGYAVMCETGELVLTGVDTLLRALRKLALSRGSYTLTGINTILKALRKLITNTGSYILTGVDTVLKAFRKLVSSVGSYVLTGIGAGLGAFRKMMVDAGSYTLTGIATGLNRLYTFIISAGSYALTGIEAIFYKAYVLIASVGSYILTGTKAKLTAWIKEILHSATWTKEDTHSAEWTKEDTHNTIWHKE